MCLAAGVTVGAGPVGAASAAAQPVPVVPVKGMVTMVDFGAGYCPPCRLMEPVLKSAEREYKGRAAVVVVDVTAHAALATHMGVRVIPTQIFFDKSGREVARHEGYLERKALNGQLDRMLAQ
ncbi:MAG: thiol reductase thioredoxin [Desulfovibrionaceae bacterium CG1_02_65_16]|nr:MAG: thiol reductase thioredoxin [Desulfovibrionaceae bacterium CG1_02_65_16]